MGSTSAGLMYGAGLRLMEACRIRVKDVDFDGCQIMVRDGKGAKDRAVPLPQRLMSALKRQVEFVTDLHAKDLATSTVNVWLPYALAAKYPQAGQSLAYRQPSSVFELFKPISACLPFPKTLGICGLGAQLYHGLSPARLSKVQ
ncbi:MAG: tyrosine-type recombinase/integrase [Planctomycetes bacterium]|nr:tyrosine-type recombinase/integrase [Planctomycetota bacterium]